MRCKRQWISNDNDEIVTSVQKESDYVDDETDEDADNESDKGPSNADAFSTIETTMEWILKCCPNSNPRRVSRHENAVLEKFPRQTSMLHGSVWAAMRITLERYPYKLQHITMN
ncbi:hypothetical protein TNCV_850601 [Trichonephila clavipes]|uniref:Uncharacterized protein n=1 Tax=Trichonephila clavipes TaxID=2585209 RepID=A0A8X6S1Z3_TRICX|nr:hypothetical protein TNCV_850601 [Trichonephila clavipes]